MHIFESFLNSWPLKPWVWLCLPRVGGKGSRDDGSGRNPESWNLESWQKTVNLSKRQRGAGQRERKVGDGCTK